MVGKRTGATSSIVIGRAAPVSCTINYITGKSKMGEEGRGGVGVVVHGGMVKSVA